jgi:type I restriction enzyme S subunit
MSGQTEIIWGEEVLEDTLVVCNTQEVWNHTTLSGLIEVQNGYAFKSEDFSLTEGVPVVKIKNIASGELTLRGLQYYPHSVEKLSRFFIRRGDILIAMTGSHANQPSSIVGKVARYDLDDFALLNQRVGKIYSVDENVLDNDFIYWFFKQWDVTFELAVSAGGSANQANISTVQIKALELELPPILEQRAIAGVLSSLDDKLDLLHRQNSTLETLAETLFQQWFVEEANEEWAIGKLPDEFVCIMGSSPPGESYNELGDGVPMFQGNADFGFRFPSNRVYTTDAKRIAVKYDTLISVRAPVGAQNMASEECCIGRGVAAFRYKYDPAFYTYCYFKMRSLMVAFKEFNQTGTVFGAISKADVDALVITIPPVELVRAYQDKVKPIDDKVIRNCDQIKVLSTLRDTLLPKLMSGEVRVAY